MGCAGAPSAPNSAIMTGWGGRRAWPRPGRGGGARGGTIVHVTTTAPRLLQVRRSARVTPRMIRVTLAGDELAGFAGDGPDRRIKMFFPVAGQERPAVPRASTGGPVWPSGEARPDDPHLHRAPVRPRRRRARRRLRAPRGPRPGRGVGKGRAAGRVGRRLGARRALRTGPDRRLPRRDRRRDRPARGRDRARRDRPRADLDVPRGRRRRRGADTCPAPSRGCTETAAARASRSPRPCAPRAFPTAAGRRGSPANRRACGTCAGTSSTTVASTDAWSTPPGTGATADGDDRADHGTGASGVRAGPARR